MGNIITVKRTLSTEMLSDILITAFDGSYGWSWHWFEPAPVPEGESWLNIEKQHPGNVRCTDDLWMAVKVRLKEDCKVGYNIFDDDNGYWIDHNAILTGIQRILDDDYLRIKRAAQPIEMEAIKATEAWQQGAVIGNLYGRRWEREAGNRNRIQIETGETARGLRSQLAAIMGETEPDAGDIDAPFADAIVQVGAFGKCIFS